MTQYMNGPLGLRGWLLVLVLKEGLVKDAWQNVQQCALKVWSYQGTYNVKCAFKSLKAFPYHYAPGICKYYLTLIFLSRWAITKHMRQKKHSGYYSPRKRTKYALDRILSASRVLRRIAFEINPSYFRTFATVWRSTSHSKSQLFKICFQYFHIITLSIT